MENITEKNQTTETFACTNCGADLKYAPGTTQLTCEYCGTQNEIPVLEADIEELDFNTYLNNAGQESEQFEISTIKCEDCGAESTLESGITASSCPYCDTPLILEHRHSENIIQPKSLLPFKINKNEALNSFKKWIKKLWFAPSALKKAVLSFDHFKGVYLPFWTYDSNASTSYIGQRGENYTVQERYTTTENGKTVTKTRSVTKIRWYNTSGHVHDNFDDILIPANTALPQKLLRKLEPWDLENLVAFDSKYLSGFIAEKYQCGLKEGFDEAKGVMDNDIRIHVKRDIGGDHQRIIRLHTNYSDITFKHIYLPVYVSAYKFKNKLYRFMINARTGEVQGERPWSAIKIILFVLAILGIGAGIYYFTQIHGTTPQ